MTNKKTDRQTENTTNGIILKSLILFFSLFSNTKITDFGINLLKLFENITWSIFES